MSKAISTARPSQCTVCSHPKRAELERALILKERTAADIARQLGIHRSAVTRHTHKHLLPEASAEARKRQGEIIIQAEVGDLYERTRDLLQRCESSEENWPIARGFISEARQNLELLAKLRGELSQRDPEQSSNTFVLVPIAVPAVHQAAALPPAPAQDIEWTEVKGSNE